MARKKISRCSAATHILKTLRDKDGELRFDEIIVKLRPSGFVDDAAIKSAIWQLIADSKIEFTQKRKLRVHSS